MCAIYSTDKNPTCLPKVNICCLVQNRSKLKLSPFFVVVLELLRIIKAYHGISKKLKDGLVEWLKR
jgi:hypothetical protein